MVLWVRIRALNSFLKQFYPLNFEKKIDFQRCIFAELLTKNVLFKGKEIKDQLENIYNMLGHPHDSWAEVTNLKFYKDLKPKKKYRKTLKEYLNKWCPFMDPQCLDLLDRMLSYNPAQRISAKSALNHPFFSTNPLPCKPKDIKHFQGKEYHYYLINESKFPTSVEPVEV